MLLDDRSGWINAQRIEISGGQNLENYRCFVETNARGLAILICDNLQLGMG